MSSPCGNRVHVLHHVWRGEAEPEARAGICRVSAPPCLECVHKDFDMFLRIARRDVKTRL